MMLTWTRLLALFAALALTACMSSGPVDWTEKLESSDRLSTVKGMLAETRAYDEQVELYEAAQAPSLNQVDAFLKLDLGPVDPEATEGYESIEAAVETIESLRAAYQAEFDAFVDAKRADKSYQEPESMKKALTDLGEGFLKQASVLKPFLSAKVKHKREVYAEALVAKYNEGEPCRHFEIVDALRALGNGLIAVDEAFLGGPLYNKIVNDVLLKALTSDIQQPPLTALTAAGTLEKWRVKEHLDAYVKVIEDKKLHFDLRDAMIKLLTSFSAEELKAHKPTLLKILNTAPELQPISYIAKSAVALGEMGADEAVDRLVECLWLDDARGRDATSQCRLALNHLDPAKVSAAALKAFKRQDAKVEERALALNYAHTGLVEAKAADLLADTKSTEATRYLIASLNHEDVNPAPFAADATKATFFTKGQVQKTISLAHALAVLGEDEGTKPLMNIIASEKAFEYKLAAAQQLAYLGSDAPMRDLIKVFNKKLEQLDLGNRDLKVQYGKTIALLINPKSREYRGFKRDVTKSLEESQGWIKTTEDQIKQAKDQETKLGEEVEKLKGEVKEMKAKGVKVPSPPRREKVAKMEDKEAYKAAKKAAQEKLEAEKKAYEEALTDDQKKLRELEDKVEATEKAKTKVKNLAFEVERGLKIYQSWETGFKEIMDQLKVLEECGSDLAAWTGKLSNHPMPVRTIAAYVLSRKDQNHGRAAKTLLERVTQEKDAAIRDVLLFGLARHANKAHLDELKSARAFYEKKRKEGSKDPSLKGTIYSLDLMIASLSH